MNTNDHNTRQDAIEEAFCHYLKRVDAGEPIDKDDFLAQYPEIADSLAEHLAADSVVRKLAGPTFAETQTDLQGTLIVSSKEPSALNETVISSPSMDTHCDKQSTNWGIPEQFGRYLVKKLLGQGAMGAVYLAHDTQLDRDVALKVPKFEKQKDSEVLERFYREARAVATLHHPNICPVYDVGEIEGQPFLSMAYIEGRPLSDFAKSMKKQAERSAAKLVMKLALALQEAHEIGVVHRDLKPANIMVGKKGEPVVMDFGLARRLDSNDTRVTQSGTIVGTPAYMSPEQVEGNSNAIGPKSDQYSLGVIFYELLTGRLPFQGSVLSVIGQIAHMEPPSINKLRSDVDSRLAAIGKKMMAKPPQDRYENMAAVASAINAYLVESKIEASPENQSLWDQTKAATPKQKVSEPTRRTPARSLPGKTAPQGKRKAANPQSENLSG